MCTDARGEQATHPVLPHRLKRKVCKPQSKSSEDEKACEKDDRDCMPQFQLCGQQEDNFDSLHHVREGVREIISFKPDSRHLKSNDKL